MRAKHCGWLGSFKVTGHLLKLVYFQYKLYFCRNVWPLKWDEKNAQQQVTWASPVTCSTNHHDSQYTGIYYPTVSVVVQKAHKTSTNIPFGIYYPTVSVIVQKACETSTNIPFVLWLPLWARQSTAHLIKIYSDTSHQNI